METLLTQFEIDGLRAIRTRSMDFSPFTVVQAPRARGKSTVIDAIALWAEALHVWCKKRAHNHGWAPITRQGSNAIDAGASWERIWNAQEPWSRASASIGLTATLLGSEPITMEICADTTEQVKVKPLAAHRARARHSAAPRWRRAGPCATAAGRETLFTPVRTAWGCARGESANFVRNRIAEIGSDGDDQNWVAFAESLEQTCGICIERPIMVGPDLIAECTDSGGAREIGEVGNGAQATAMVLATVACARNGIALLDQPDAGLGPEETVSLYAGLRALGERTATQIIATTAGPVLGALCATRERVDLDAARTDTATD